MKGEPARSARKRPFIGIRGLALCLALALGWHVLWAVALAPAPELLSRPPVRVPQLLFAPAVEPSDEDQTDPRAIWSPTLFSLPTPMGFSRSAFDRRAGARPPDVPTLAASYVIERLPAGPAAPLFDRAAPLAEQVSGRLFEVGPPPLGPAAFSPPTNVALPGVQVEFAGELAGRQWASWMLPDMPAALRRRPWEVTAAVESDDGVRLTHVFLEVPTAFPEVNQLVEGALRRARLAAGTPVSSGRVVIRSAAPPGAAGEKARP